MNKITGTSLQISLLLLLVACNTAPTSMQTPATEPSSSQSSNPEPFSTEVQIPTEPIITPLPTSITVPNSVAETEAIVKEFLVAWDAHDPDKLSSFYAEDVMSFDATAGSESFNKGTIDGVLHSSYVNGAFGVKLNSFFVSDDGRFAASIGIFSEKDDSGKLISKPYVSLLEIKGDKIIWVYDYYGGCLSESLLLQTIPATANQPAASNLVDEIKSMIERWEAAYNTRDSQTFLAFYSDQAENTDVIAPEWRVLTKKALEQETTLKFSSEKFKSELDTFFVSANGHFVAIQGTYKDQKTVKIPMVIILEIENNKIIKQNNYLVYVEVF
jgi:ketosteroid isomerase-like protein